MINEKITKSGRLLDVDFYPIYENGRKMPVRAAKTKPSSEVQARYNANMAVKKSMRFVNANFTTGDLLLTLNFAPENAPEDYEEAHRLCYNFFRVVKRMREKELIRTKKEISELKVKLEAAPKDKYLKDKLKELKKKRKLLKREFKYYCVIAEDTYKSGKHKGKKNFHAHLFFTGGLDRDVCEGLWKHGERVNCDRYRPEIFGPEAAAKYAAKNPRGNRRFCYSKNMVDPQVREKRGSVTRQRVEKMCKERVDDAGYWERRYPGYRFIRAYPRFNDFNGHWYLSVVMYRPEEMDKETWWQKENWDRWFDVDF